MSAFRLPRHPEAFSNAPAQGRRRPRQTDDAHLRWLRTLPCVITGTRPVEAAHIRFADPAYGKSQTGKAEKPSDRWCLPVSPALHREQHDGNEIAFWTRHGMDPCKVALALFAASGDDEQAELILRNARLQSRPFTPGRNRAQGSHE